MESGLLLKKSLCTGRPGRSRAMDEWGSCSSRAPWFLLVLENFIHSAWSDCIKKAGRISQPALILEPPPGLEPGTA